MRSCAEAHYKFKVCGHTKRDADGDGIPCEDLCGKDIATYQSRVKAQGGDVTIAADEPAALDASEPADSALGLVSSPDTSVAVEDEGASFTCAGKRTCGQMLSCAEAQFYLSSCRVKSLDRDGDGVPCNSLCR